MLQRQVARPRLGDVSVMPAGPKLLRARFGHPPSRAPTAQPLHQAMGQLKRSQRLMAFDLAGCPHACPDSRVVDPTRPFSNQLASPQFATDKQA